MENYIIVLMVIIGYLIIGFFASFAFAAYQIKDVKFITILNWPYVAIKLLKNGK